METSNTTPARKGLSALLHRGTPSSRSRHDSFASQQSSSEGTSGGKLQQPAVHTGSSAATHDQAVLARLRVQIISGHKLLGRDRNGKSDPFVVLSIPGAGSNKQQTPVIPRTVDPVWPEAEATFEYEVTSSWFGEASGDELLTARRTNRRTFSGSAGRYLLQSARKIPRGAVAGAKVVRRRAPRPMRIRRNVQSQAQRGPVLSENLSPQPKQHRTSPSPSPPATADSEKATTKLVIPPIDTRSAAATISPPDLSPPPGSAILNPSGAAHVPAVQALEFVLWDKDRFSANDYLGECSLPVEAWLPNLGGAVGDTGTNSPSESQEEKLGLIAWEKAQPITLPVVSHRRRREVSGELVVKVGLLPSPAAGAFPVEEVYQRLLIANATVAGGVRSVPADQSLGTTAAAEAFIDDGLSSESEDEEEVLASEDEDASKREAGDDASDTEGDVTTDGEDVYALHYQSIAGVPTMTGIKSRESSPETSLQAPAPATKPPSITTPAEQEKADQQAPATVAARRKLFGRRSSKHDSTASIGSDAASGASSGGKVKRIRRPRVKRSRGKWNRKEFAFKAEMGMDIIGIVMMEVKSAADLPKWKNVTKTGYDMDPFAIVSFGQKIFRTRVVRHSLSPVWDEKLLFHVRRHEAGWKAKFAVYDWDRMSSHDFVGGADLDISKLIDMAPKPDARGLYKAEDEDASDGMQKFTLSLTPPDGDPKAKATITVQAKFTPYDSLRQRFWRHLLQQFDTTDSESLSELELTSMLDSLGSTLTPATIKSWFEANGKSVDEDELSYEEAILALEEEIKKPWSQKRKVQLDSGINTPALNDLESSTQALDISGVNAATQDEGTLATEAVPVPQTVVDPSLTASSNAPSSHPLRKDLSSAGMSVNSTTTSSASSTMGVPARGHPARSASLPSEAGSEAGETQVEQVIKLKSCPLCHMPRLGRKGEVDIVTHLAVCASQDWRRLDSMSVRNFVTATQAHRKWYTKVLTKISSGSYSLGANSANIIVQDRMTGELLEEKMQVYVRLGIRLLYQGARSRVQGARVKKMLKNMTLKQGEKFENPASVQDIPPFIAFFNLNMDEALEPIENFKTFNQFFYRKLKPDARPVSSPDDPTVLVSAADCRMTAFKSVSEATRIWIKGRDFTVETLLGDAYKGKVDKYKNGALCIFRLAPQDYHRYHCPADATVGKITRIDGEYFTVNPMAIRSTIDVYGENQREIMEFHSPQFGTFYAVCVGAMMVSTIVDSVKEGDKVKRGDEFGYFAFGGSTIVLVFEQGRVEFDDDLITNSEAAIETLVRVGMNIGKALTPAS